jgi:phosphate uptake regulator
MERQLVKQGRNAMTITLPAKWIKENNLSEKDSIQINEENENLLISTNTNKKKKTECEINLIDCDKSQAYHILMGKYIEGYDKITIKHNNSKLIQKACKILIGFMIEEHTNSKTITKSLIQTPEENFEILLRRTLQLFIEQTRTLYLLTQNKAKYEDVKNEEYLLDDNIIYCLRYLNKYDNQTNKTRYFLLLTTLEQAGDQISEISKFIKNDEKLGKLILEEIENYVSLLLQKNVKKITKSLKNFRSKIPNEKFVEGISYSLADTLYNYIGYLIEKKEK